MILRWYHESQMWPSQIFFFFIRLIFTDKDIIKPSLDFEGDVQVDQLLKNIIQFVIKDKNPCGSASIISFQDILWYLNNYYIYISYILYILYIYYIYIYIYI